MIEARAELARGSTACPRALCQRSVSGECTPHATLAVTAAVVAALPASARTTRVHPSAECRYLDADERMRALAARVITQEAPLGFVASTARALAREHECPAVTGLSRSASARDGWFASSGRVIARADRW